LPFKPLSGIKKTMIETQHCHILDEISARLDRPISLVGMMGAGKTRLGRMLSQSLNFPFVDSDEEIEQATTLSINEIFEQFGEPYFRDGEKRVMRRLIDGQPKIIATGGGAMMNPETEDALLNETICIWVYADLEVMAQRAVRGEKRPLLKQGNALEIFKNLSALRNDTYARAHIAVESNDEADTSTLDQALMGIHRYLYNAL
jgi:shikimate kinase